MNTFKTMLINSDFSEIFMEECPNNAYNKFVLIYKKHSKIHFPLKR